MTKKRKRVWARINDISIFVLSAGGSVSRSYFTNGFLVSAVAQAVVLAWFAVGLWEYIVPALLKRVNHDGRRANVIRFFIAPGIGWFSADIINLAQQWLESRIGG